MKISTVPVIVNTQQMLAAVMMTTVFVNWLWKCRSRTNCFLPGRLTKASWKR